MTSALPPSLLSLFAPRPPIMFLAPMEKRPPPPYTGIGQFVSEFKAPDVDEAEKGRDPFETKQMRKVRFRKNKIKKHDEVIVTEAANWDPSKYTKATTDPYKTLFVARLNYNTSENKVKREFEQYGPVKKVRLIEDTKSNKPRGFAFVEYERERDMKVAYKQADGRKIDGRRVVVDVERGRTVRNWRPRRLGGGLGKTRVGGDDVNQKFSGREPPRTGDETIDRERPRSKDSDRPSSAATTTTPSKDRDSGRERERERSRSPKRERERDRDTHKRDRDGKEKHSSRRERSRERDKERGDRSDRGDRGDRDRKERDGKEGKDSRDRDVMDTTKTEPTEGKEAREDSSHRSSHKD